MSGERDEHDAPAADRGAADRGAADRGVSREKRPLLERLGLALIALVIGGLFGGMALAALIGGELFLAVMAGVGCAMTLWVGGLTLVRG